MLIPISTVTAFLVTFIMLPVIINVSRSVDLMDMPDRRKLHRFSAPSMGGIAIYFGWLIAVIIATPIFELSQYKFILSGILLIYILGFRDDISSLKARHKLAFQVLAAVLVVYFGKISVSNLYGLFGIGIIPQELANVLTVIGIVFLTNAFNLIDGIDGLAGSITVLSGVVISWINIELGHIELAILSLTLCGAMLAFLFFNWYPSKIFMGDTGSMTSGFFISVLSAMVLQRETVGSVVTNFNSVAVFFALLVLPIYDTVRVITIRLSSGISPFVPDRNHIHHAVLRLGLNHGKATILLLSVNVVLVGFAIFSSFFLSETASVILIAGGIAVFGLVVDFIGKRYGQKRLTGTIMESEAHSVSKSA